jgi:peptide/nickel transport system permease protein
MMGRLGALIVLIVGAAALVGPWILPADPFYQDLPLRLASPSWGHPLGLDELGRDLFARLVLGARVSLFVGIVVVGVSATVGSIVGGIAGYAGGWVDMALGRLMDVLMAFPASCSRLRWSRCWGRASSTSCWRW